MKLSVNINELVNAMKYANAMVPRGGINEALRQVSLETDGATRLHLRTSDLSAFTSIAIDANGSDTPSPTEALVDAKFLFSLVRSLSSKEVALEFGYDQKHVVLESDGARHVIPVFPERAAFPPWADDAAESDEQVFSLAASTLREVLLPASLCSAHDRSRYSVEGVVVQIKNGTLRAISLDGHRLGSSEFHLPKGKGFTGEITISLPAVKALSLMPPAELVRIRLLPKKNKNHAARWIFEADNSALIAVDQKQAIPDCVDSLEPEGAKIDLATSALASVANAASRLSDGKHRRGKLSISVSEQVIEAVGLDPQFNPRFSMQLGKTDSEDSATEVIDARFLTESIPAFAGSESIAFTFPKLEGKPIMLSARTSRGVEKKIILATITNKNSRCEP